MKARWIMLAAVVLVGAGLAFWQVGLVSPAVAGDQAITAATTLSGAVPALGEEYEYVGSKKCKKCHIKEYKSWEDTKKAKTFETLKPGQGSEAKEKAKLDPAKDYTKDESCLACHTVGFGKPGGYATPDPADEKAVKEASQLEGVGCESCHGPGSKYVDVHEEIKKSGRKYKTEELYAVGMTKIDAENCKRCHNEKSPTYQPFDFDKQKHEGSHEMFPLSQRED